MCQFQDNVHLIMHESSWWKPRVFVLVPARYFRNFWVGMCRWEPGTLSLYQSYKQLQNCWDTPRKKWPFLLQIAPGHRSVRYNTNLPPPSHSAVPFKVVPPSFEHGLVLLVTLIRGGGISQAQHHGQAIYAKIRYSASSIFATGCSSAEFCYPILD